MINKTYSELIKIPTFKGRFEYLKLCGIVGEETFGHNRYLNQSFYHSKEWKDFRKDIIVRDNGCDLGLAGYDIFDSIIIHHINPISVNDVINNTTLLLDKENVICVSETTHRAIHYSNENLFLPVQIERTKFDTCPWRNKK